MMTMPRVRLTRWLMILTSVCATVLYAATATAQPSDKLPTEGRGYLTLGWGKFDLNELNGRLTDRGYPEFPEGRFAIGAGGHGIRGRWLLGAEGQALIGRTQDGVRASQNYEVALNGGYALFNVGYLAARRGRLHAYPFAGIGGGGAQLRIAESSAPTFNEVLLDPGRSASLTMGGLVLQVGVGVDQLFVLQSKEANGQRTDGGLVFGIRVGYVFMPARSDWRLNSTRVAAGPDVGLGGPYVRFVVGGGGRRSTP